MYSGQVVLALLLVAIVAVIASDEQPEQIELKILMNSSDLATEAQRYRYYRVQSVRVLPKKKVASKPSGYSGYQSGYGFFRGRRSANNDESVLPSD